MKSTEMKDATKIKYTVHSIEYRKSLKISQMTSEKGFLKYTVHSIEYRKCLKKMENYQ